MDTHSADAAIDSTPAEDERPAPQPRVRRQTRGAIGELRRALRQAFRANAEPTEILRIILHAHYSTTDDVPADMYDLVQNIARASSKYHSQVS